MSSIKREMTSTASPAPTSADQDYITAGITQLTTYFKVSILLGVAAVLVAIAAAIGLAGQCLARILKREDIMSDVPGTPGSGGLSRIPFTVAAENQIKSLSFWLTIVGWLNAFAAVGDIINLAMPQRNFGQIINLILHIAVATWSLQAARAFKSVATTDVADQAYLVEGFTKLRSLFLLQGVIVLVELAFVTAVLLFVGFYHVAR